jgi:hypothetical protein
MVRSGDIFLKNDGTVDRRCAAVRSGDVFFKNDGTIDKRCAAYRGGGVRSRKR